MILSHQLYRTKQLLLPLCIWETLARSAIYTDFLFLLCKNETKVKTKHFFIVGFEFWHLESWKYIYFLIFDFFIKQSWLGCEEHQGSKVITQCAPLVLTYSITPWFVHNLIKSVNISVLCGALLDLLHSRTYMFYVLLKLVDHCLIFLNVGL